MLPPKRIFSPYFATFQVPLRFNKLDLRDYLYHAYGVEVRSVRSWLTAQLPRRRYQDNENDDSNKSSTTYKDIKALRTGPWYRPQPIKRMMVELVKPFAFPEPPHKPTAEERGTDADPRKDWDYDTHERVQWQQQILEEQKRRMAHDKEFRMRVEDPHVPTFRVGLARQARELVLGQRVWRNDAKLDERWDAIEGEERSSSRSSQKDGRRTA